MYALRRKLAWLMFLLLLVGCSAPAGELPVEESPAEVPAEEVPVVAEPRPVEILYPNPLSFTYTEVPSDSGYRSKLEIGEGLASSEMTLRLEEKITTTYEGLESAGPPPYRGIRVLLEEDEVPVSESMYANESFNHNGLSSLIFNHDLGFTKDRYVSEIRALTLDLATGDSLALADLFENKEEEVFRYFNEKVRERLMADAAGEEREGQIDYWDGDRLRLAGRFDGIAPDQAYYLSRTGLTLVFDHRTPAFATGFHPDYATGFHPAYLQIPYYEISRELTMIDAFFTPRPTLFTADEPLVPELIVRDTGDMGGALRNETREGVTLYIEARYPENMPEGVEGDIEALLEPDEDLLGTLIARADETTGEPSYHHYLWMNYCGPYLSLNRTIDLYDGTSWESHALHRIYDEEGRRLTAEDLFTDPDLVVHDHLLPALEREMAMAGVTERVSTQALIEGITLGLGGGEIQVATDAVALEDGGLTSLRFHVTYADLGVDQLKFLARPRPSQHRLFLID